MPTWGEILRELNRSQSPGASGPDFDGVRRGYLRALSEMTGRAVILYSTAWVDTSPVPVQPADLQIGLGDVQGFMEAVSNIEEDELDLIIHSPGGSAEAAESIVEYLRQRFSHIRVVVPLAAMSAATMIALSADEVVMGQHSQLGPIDPQFIISTPEGARSAPAKAILNQFEQAKKECRDPSNLPAWMPIIRTYAPGLLTQCEDSRELASQMVANWLERYMFSGDEDSELKAKGIAEWFADYETFHSHGRRVGYEQVSEKGIRVSKLEDDHDLQDAVLSIHHATAHTFSSTPSVKIIENHHGRAWIRSVRVEVQQVIPAQQRTPQAQQNQPNRAERRRLGRRQ